MKNAVLRCGRGTALLLLLLIGCAESPAAGGQAPHGQATLHTPVTLTVIGRERVNATQCGTPATPNAEVYGHLDSLLRIALAQRVRRIDWQAELLQSAELFLPKGRRLARHSAGATGPGRHVLCREWQQHRARSGLLQDRLRAIPLSARQRHAARRGALSSSTVQRRSRRTPTLAWLQPNRMAQRADRQLYVHERPAQL